MAFTDFIDTGAFGNGILGRDGDRLTMDAQAVGNPKHPSWRAWMQEAPDSQTVRVEALQDRRWVDFGTFAYRREKAPDSSAPGPRARGTA